MDDLQYSKEAYKKDAVQLSEYIRIMDDGMCTMPELEDELTAGDRKRIQFVVGVMKKDELALFMEEADNVIIQIDPDVGPAEDFVELLRRWRRGPQIGSKSTPAPEPAAQSRLNNIPTPPKFTNRKVKPNESAAEPQEGRKESVRCETPTSQFLDNLMSGKLPTPSREAQIDRESKSKPLDNRTRQAEAEIPREPAYTRFETSQGDDMILSPLRGDNATQTISVEEVQPGEDIVSHRGKTYILRSCTCGFKGKTVHSIRMHMQHRKDPLHAWYNAKNAHESILQRCGIMIIGDTSSLLRSTEDSSTAAQQPADTSSFHIASHTSPQLSQYYKNVPKVKISEDSDYWARSWISLRSFEQNSISEEQGAKTSLHEAEARLKELQGELNRAEDQFYPDRQTIVRLKREMEKTQAEITRLSVQHINASTMRREAENLSLFFKSECKIHPNQLLDKDFLPEKGLVNKPNLLTIRAAINKLAKVREYWPEFEPEAWLRDRLATLLWDHKVKRGNRDALKTILQGFSNDPELDAIHREVQHIREQLILSPGEVANAEASKSRDDKPASPPPAAGADNKGVRFSLPTKRRQESSPEAEDDNREATNKSSLHHFYKNRRTVDNPEDLASTTQRIVGDPGTAWLSNSQRSYENTFSSSTATNQPVKLEEHVHRTPSPHHTASLNNIETYAAAPTGDLENHRLKFEMEAPRNSVPSRPSSSGHQQSAFSPSRSNHNDRKESHSSASPKFIRCPIRYLQSDRRQIYDSQHSIGFCHIENNGKSIAFAVETQFPMPDIPIDKIVQVLFFSDDQRLVLWEGNKLVRIAFWSHTDAITFRNKLVPGLHIYARVIEEKAFLEKIFRIPSATYRQKS